MGLFSLFGRSHPPPSDDPDSFGNIAKELGFIDDLILQRALAAQRAKSPLGELLVEMGELTEFERDEVILEQRRRRATSKHERALVTQRQQRLRVRRMSARLAVLNNTLTTLNNGK